MVTYIEFLNTQPRWSWSEASALLLGADEQRNRLKLRCLKCKPNNTQQPERLHPNPLCQDEDADDSDGGDGDQDGDCHDNSEQEEPDEGQHDAVSLDGDVDEGNDDEASDDHEWQ